MDSLSSLLKSDFRVADAGFFYAERVATTSEIWHTLWDNWPTNIQPLGADPHLQDVGHIHQVQVLTGFATQV